MDECFDVVRDDDTVVVLLVGDLDLAAQASAELAVAEALSLRPTRLLLDLSQVVFLDSSGLTVLLRARRAAETEGIAFAVVGPFANEVRRVITLTGLDGLLETDDAPS